MKHLIALMRPAQWLKDVFIMLPLFFSRNIMSADGLINVAYTFVAFSLAASSIYCFNDIMYVTKTSFFKKLQAQLKRHLRSMHRQCAKPTVRHRHE